MYVKKDELRAAVAERIAELNGTAEKPPVKTSATLRAEYNTLCTEITARQGERLLAYVKADTARLTKVDAHGFYQYDGWAGIRTSVEIKLDPEEQERLLTEQAAIKAADKAWRDAYDLEWYGRNRGRRSDYTPASLRELEAWLVRLDNDVKTATVNIKREFAQELGLI